MIRPSWGFSFAVSGSTIPLFVISSRAVGLTTTRSPSGCSFEAVFALAKVFPPGTTGVVERLLYERRLDAGDRRSGAPDGLLRAADPRRLALSV
jgi:hypothetical protein